MKKKLKERERDIIKLNKYTSISFIVILTFFFSHFQSEEKKNYLKKLFNYYSTFHRSKNNLPPTWFVTV
jgi:hypothetical protein